MSRFLIVLCLLVSACAQFPSGPKKHSTDAHMHVSQNPTDDDLQLDAERALFAADSVDVERAIIISNAYSKMAYEDFARRQNSFIAQEVKKHPTRLAGACAVNPLADWAREEMRRCRCEGFKVLKLHTMASGMDLRNEAHYRELKRTLTLAKELEYTVLIHGNFPQARRGNEAELLIQMVNEFSQIRFILGHLMGKEFQVLKNLKNKKALIEVSATPIWMKTSQDREALAKVMRDVGLERFIFGSDWPVIHPAETLKALKQLPLRTGELNQILYENAQSLDDLFR